jgi:hypothetical protein
VDEHALKRAWDDGLLTQHQWAFGAKRVRAFDLREVQTIAPMLRRSKAQARVAAMLGIPRYGVEQLVAMRLFRPAPPSAQRDQWDAPREEALRLISRLTQLGLGEVIQPVSLLEAARHVSGRVKPWGPIIQLLLEGDCSFAIVGTEARPLVKRIDISATDLERISSKIFDLQEARSSGFDTMWSQKDSLECFMATKTHRSSCKVLPAPQTGHICIRQRMFSLSRREELPPRISREGREIASPRRF